MKYDKTTNEDLFRAVALEKFDRIERMLKWLVLAKLRGSTPPPDISDILEEK